MKRKNVCLMMSLLIIIVLQMSSCNKATVFVGTYDGVTTTSGTLRAKIEGYMDTREEIPAETKTVRFVISKGDGKNKILLKQVAGDEDEHFEAIGTVSKKTVTFLPFKLPYKYGEIVVDVDVSDMKAELDKNTLTYSYSYGYSQVLPGVSVNISMHANGSAVK